MSAMKISRTSSFIKLTSHLGDSGMKNKAGINIIPGNIPERKKKRKKGKVLPAEANKRGQYTEKLPKAASILH